MIRVIITLLFSLSLTSVAHATTLKIATLAPDGTAWMKIMRAAAGEVKKKTDGRVKLRFYPGGVMGNDNSVLRKIRVGQLHGGAITGGGLAAVYPDAQLYSLPFLFHSLDEVDYVRARMDQEIIDGLRKKGFVSYGLGEGGFAYMMSNSPVRESADLRKQKIWIPEGDMINSVAFKTTGVSPIPLPITDVLTGLQTGLIDTVATSAIGAIALQWHTRVKYLTNIPLIYLYGTLAIKEKALKKLSPEDREVLHTQLTTAFQTLNSRNREDEKKALEALKKQGIDFIEPTTQGHQEWAQTAAATVKALENDGLFSPELFRKVQGLLNKYRQSNH
ncbi:MAG: C4-dicarboxylate ABC transporter [endosymbiont of Escarpia spicata]|uniref:C4-dicarboxylate ABC transporter n=1 Tax=endosymbiont of Escarpia spicata TaxID=2200908 RepID=A0A370DAI6_9GAMM|nr:MAG: C4-dicarboxylate ABC transporter [endosymbiont of Escarpia spicata]